MIVWFPDWWSFSIKNLFAWHKSKTSHENFLFCQNPSQTQHSALPSRLSNFIAPPWWHLRVARCHPLPQSSSRHRLPRLPTAVKSSHELFHRSGSRVLRRGLFWLIGDVVLARTVASFIGSNTSSLPSLHWAAHYYRFNYHKCTA